MKARILITLAMTLGASQLMANPIRKSAPISKIFVPNGFDDNDNTEVIIHGKLPSTCYQLGDAQAEVDHEEKIIWIDADVLHYPESYCVPSLTPFIKPVTTGLLKHGNYRVIYRDNQLVQAEVPVESRTTESADDYMYAPVDTAYLELDRDNGKQSLFLKGYFPHFFLGCMVLDEVKMIRAPGNVLVVQPTAKLVYGQRCEREPIDRGFKYQVDLQEPLQGEGLLHVRTLDGHSLNQFFNFPSY